MITSGWTPEGMNKKEAVEINSNDVAYKLFNNELVKTRFRVNWEILYTSAKVKGIIHAGSLFRAALFDYPVPETGLNSC